MWVAPTIIVTTFCDNATPWDCVHSRARKHIVVLSYGIDIIPSDIGFAGKKKPIPCAATLVGEIVTVVIQMAMVQMGEGRGGGCSWTLSRKFESVYDISFVYMTPKPFCLTMEIWRLGLLSL